MTLSKRLFQEILSLQQKMNHMGIVYFMKTVHARVHQRGYALRIHISCEVIVAGAKRPKKSGGGGGWRGAQ